MNKTILQGRICKDLELKYLGTSNIAIVEFCLAVPSKTKDKPANFINCKAFGKTAEFITKYFVKGSMILTEGRIENSSWDDKEGKKRYKTEIIVEQCYFCGDKKKESIDNTTGAWNDIEDSDGLPF